MGLQEIGKKIKKQTTQAMQKAQSAAKPSQTPKRTGATAVAKKTGQAAGQKVQYYSKNKGGARRTGTAVKNKVGAKVKANKNTPSPYQRQKTAQANVKMRQLNIPTMTKDYLKNPQKNPLDRRDLLSQIGGALQAAQNPADRFHGLKERSVTRSPMEQLRADAMAGRGAWASDLRVETKKSDKDKAKEIVENSKRYFRNKKIARQDLSEWDRRNMNAAQQRQVQEAKLRYKEAQKAGKKEDAARAHREAENLRGLHGYSGGAAGDQFIRPELSQGEYNALNSQGELAMRQARMARQRAVTEDEIARADQRIEAILRAPGYREGPATDADTSRGWSFGPEGRRMWAGTREQNRQDAQQSRAALQATGEGIVGGLAYAGQIANRANRDRYEAANMDQWIANADDYISAQSDLEYYDNFVRQFGRAPDDMPNRNVLVMRLNRAIQARAQLERVQGDVDSLYFDPTMAEVLGLPTTRDETFGERMLRQAAEHQAEATEGMTGAERFLTDAMISTGQSLPGMALGTIPGIGPALGLGVLGAQAAGSRAYELTQQGLTADEALRGGLISGGIEILTEKLPLEHFAKIVSGKSGRSAIKNILRQAGLEGTEEAVSYVGNYVADVAQNNPDAQFSWAELLENAGMGAVSGGIFGVGGSLIGEGRGRAAMPQIGDIQARTQEQAEAITQVQDIVSDERTQEARSLLEDTKAYNEMKQTGLYSQDELGMMRDALNERYARLAGVEEVPQTVTEPAPRTLEEAAQQRTMNVQPELPPVQWERSKFPPSSLVGSLIDAARENNARNRAAEQLRADQAAFRAQQAQREAQAAQPKAQPVQTQTAERQVQPVGQARSMVQQSPQVQRDILARNVSAFGENGRKAIMEAYQGGDAGTYRQAFAQVYDQALSGKTQEQITRPRALTEPQFYAAVQSGMNDRGAQPAARVAGRNKNAGVDWRDQYVRQMDRRTAKMVDGVARALGVRVIFADEGSILTGTGAQANAEIVGNVVRIEKNNPNPVRKLIGHELTHRMQDLSPETYQTFRDYVMSIPGAQNALEQTLALYESGTGGFTREAAMDELAADFAGELWDSSEKLQDFIRKNYTNRTLLERVRDAFRALAAKLTGREKVQADEAVRLLEDALGAASKAVETMGTADNATAITGSDRVTTAAEAVRNVGVEIDEEAEELSDVNVRYSIRTDPPPKKTGTAYKVFFAKGGQLYPPMVANPGGAGTPVGVWLDADVGQQAPPSKTGRAQVKAGGKGTQGGSGSLAFRPGWHLGDVPHATQFARMNPETGKKELFPANFVWAECEYAADVDYQDEAMSYGYTENGKFRHSYAGLPRLPQDGYYRYRTNPKPDTVPWIITGAMKVKRILTDEETDAICRENGVEPMARVGGPLTAESMERDLGIQAGETMELGTSRTEKGGKRFSLSSPVEETDRFIASHNLNAVKGARFSITPQADADYMAAVETGDMETAQRMVDEAAKAAGYERFGDFFADKSLDLGTPSPTTRQKQMFEAGKKYGDSDSGFNQFFDEDPDLAEYYVYNSNLQRWYYAGARDEMPEYRLAIRYGDIPEEGRSRNWATGELERGVSAVDFLTDKTQGKQTIYDAIYGIQDTTKNIIGGWDFGIFGSDGEPLLVGAKNIVPFTEVSKLKLADPVTYDDDGNVVPLSERFQYDNPDIRHSLAGTGGLDSARLLRENQKLRDRVEYWKGQTKKSDRAKVEPKEVKKLARRLATDFSSAMDRTEIAGELQAIYDGLGKDWTYDQAYEAAHALAMNMVEQASESDGFLYNEYEPLRMFFRENPLVISPEIKRGITDYNDWRKAQMGRLRLQSGEQSNIDQVYQEVSQLWPEWFDEEREATSLDQLERIVEVMDGIYTQEENNPFQDDLEGPAGYLAAEIMDSFWDLPNVKKTWADRAEARLGREVTRRLDMQEKYQEKLRQVREDRDRKLKEQSAAYLGKTKARSQRQKERERRAQIMRHARDLSKKLLKPSDKQHIPQQLREAVAAVLDSVNLASKNFKETNRTKAFQELRLAYQDILQQGESLVIDPDLMDNISEVEAMRDTPIAEMDLSQLETIWRTIRAVEASITTANKAFGQQRFATIFEAADGLQQAMGNRKDRGDYRGAVGAFDKLLNSGMLTPESYFHRMGQTGQDIFRMLRNAQDRHIGIMQEAQEHTEKIVGKTKVRKWEKEVHTFDFDGENVQLTTAQIMSLYELMKRQQAVDHIVVGGIKPEGVDRGVKKKAPSEPYRLTIDQISEIVDSLTEEQMAMADALQKYMGGRLAQLGNEASMAVYGYEKFNEKNYFPIKVDKNQTITDQTKEAQAATIAGRGFTKSTTPKANNALIVRNIFDVYADHVTDMATYSSWLEAMENLQRIYNFTFRDAEGNRTGTVKANLERAFGKNGLSYWEKLTEDLNNGVHGTNDNPFNSLIGNYKASAIGANIRVFIQQPTAILRALDDINPADFLAGLGRARPTTWSKVKKYAPIAVWKDWGYFDADTGRQMKSILFGDDSALAKVNNGLMAPAGAMDSLGWSHIWNALEAETRRTRKDLKPRTDEFYQAVAARFNAVIDHSQVVDGILQRSQVMRSPDALTKMATSFMAEPTKVYNMFTTAVYDLHHSQDPKARTQAMKVMGRTTFALIASFFANAAAQSLVDALRDDDKDEDYWEKFFQAFYGLEGDEETTGAKIKNGILEGNLGAAFNPATYIPWMKDVVSLAQGFKVSRMDMDSISKFVQEIGSTWKAFHGDGKITLQNALTRLAAEGARLLGIPASNIKRDVLAIYSTAMNSQKNYLGQFELQKWLYRMDNANNQTEFVKIAYAAQQAGDTTAYEKIKAELVDAMGQEKYDEKVKNLTKKDMEAGGDLENRVADTYGAYETMMAGNPGYQSLTAEQQAKVQDSLTGYAQMQVTEEASGGELVSNDNEMAAIRAAEQAGIDPVTWKSFKVFCADTSADKKEDGTSIRGSKKAKVEAWLDENEITGSAREYCMEHYN